MQTVQIVVLYVLPLRHLHCNVGAIDLHHDCMLAQVHPYVCTLPSAMLHATCLCAYILAIATEGYYN